MARWIVWLGLLAVLLVAGSEQAGGSRAAPSLAALNIQLHDLPTGFTLALHQEYTPAQWDAYQHMAAGTSVKQQLLRADVGIFDLPHPNATHAVIAILIRYVDAAAAHGAYLIDTNQTRRHVRPVALLQSLAAPGVGLERYGVKFPDPTAALSPLSVLFFRRGVYVAALAIDGYTHSYPAARTIDLARIVDARIRQDG